LSVCFAAAGIVKVLSVAAFTLVWTHSIEKIEWQEDWHVTPQGLQIVTARVKGSGAGMEPPPEARLVNGWFQWSPTMAPLAEVALGNSGLAGEWRICTLQGTHQGTHQGCRTLSDIIGHPLGTQTTIMKACEPAGKHSGNPADKHAAIRPAPAADGGFSIAPRPTHDGGEAGPSGSGAPMNIARPAA
jgi:hypothetical protein